MFNMSVGLVRVGAEGKNVRGAQEAGGGEQQTLFRALSAGRSDGAAVGEPYKKGRRLPTCCIIALRMYERRV